MANLLREAAGARYPLVRGDGAYRMDLADGWRRPGAWALAAHRATLDPRDTPVTAGELAQIWEGIPDEPAG